MYKYLGKDDFSPEPPASAGTASVMDQYRRIIEGYLEEDSRNWRKQRHTGRKIYERLRDEHGCEASESTVRHYVTKVRRERGGQKSQFLTLVWRPGEAQVDFGEADFYVMGVRRRLYFMAVSFPYSNVGLAQLFPGQNAKCVCQGLKNVFEYLGGVPLRLVFDNATGVGRKVSDTFRTTDTFGAFAAHYGFSFSFCNPNSGHEKGNVERKVCFIRNSLFVPVPVVTSVESYNRHLPDRCMALSKGRAHWLKGEPEDQLFVEDRFALSGLPAKPFEVVKYVEPKTDKQGRFRLDGVHTYSTAPSLASARIVVGVTAHKVKVYNAAGALVCEHARAYGDARRIPKSRRASWRCSAPQIQIDPLVEGYGVAVATGLPVAGHARLYQQPLALVVAVGCYLVRQRGAGAYNAHPFCQDEKTRLPAEMLRLDS